MILRRTIAGLFPVNESLSGPDFAKRLEWLMLVRLIVTTLLLGATIFFHAKHVNSLFAETAIPLYVLIGALFLLSLLYALALPRMRNYWGFSFFQVMADVVYYTVLVYFTGDASSPFLLIYVFPIISSGILHLRRGAYGTASVASILFGTLVTLQFHGILPHSEWPWVSPWAKEAPRYVLWIVVVHFTIFFLTAFLSSSIAEQLRSTRASLWMSQRDYRNLSGLHSSIVHSIPSGIITTDERDRISYVNDSGANVLRSSTAELLGMSLTRVFPEIANGLTRSPTHRDRFVTTKALNGEIVHLEMTFSDLRGEDGLPKGRLVVFHDITEIKKMEERVKVSERQAAFVRIAAGMAHEIRNPLAALRGAAELLSQCALDTTCNTRLFDIVIREADRLNSLLGDFLVVVSPMEQVKSRVMLNSLVHDTIELFSKGLPAEKHLSVETLISRGVEVEGDAAKLKQAVWNLLTNASEASSRGGVIRVVLQSDEQEAQAVLAVQDLGEGIPPEIKDRIFEPFTTTKEGGTGLGLPLVLSIVAAHNGVIEFDSKGGKSGTTFIMRLPLAHTERITYDGGKPNNE